MKALTLTQPWATLVAIGAKTIETRSWGTPHRGPLAIHAAKGYPKEARQFAQEPVVYEAMRVHGASRLWPDIVGQPLGCVVATCKLADCVRISEWMYAADGAPAGILREWTYLLAENLHEREFGDYGRGRYAWILVDVKPLLKPIPAKGSLGLWNWEGGKS
jgi:hypothetical protein